jgi:hypothetical protein
MLCDFCCSMTCLKWLRLLNEPLKNIMRCFYCLEALIWFSPWCFIWVDLAHAYNMYDSYKVAISLYDHLVFDFWCYFMLLLMMFCRYAWLWPLLLSSPSILLALILYWVWALLVHPIPKTKLCQCVHHTYLLAICYSKVHSTCFYLSFKLNSFWCYAKIGQ